MKIDEYVEEFDSIDPLESYKPWVKQSKSSRDILMPSSDRKISAVFVCSDPVDWGRDLQVKLFVSYLSTVLEFWLCWSLVSIQCPGSGVLHFDQCGNLQ